MINNEKEVNTFNFISSNIINSFNEFNYWGKDEKKKEKFYVYKNAYKDILINIEFARKINININNKIKMNFEYDQMKSIKNIIYMFFEKECNTNFSIKKIDTMFLANFFWKKLYYVENAKIDEIKIDDLYVMHQGKDTKILNTKYYEALEKGKKVYIPSVYNTNHYGETNFERVINVLESIKKYKYPLDSQYIIVYNNENKIRDGQHRGCALRYLYGNISIPIMRIYYNKTRYDNFYKKI